MAPYILLNTEKLNAALNKFDPEVFKLMSNSDYDKTCEGKRNRTRVSVVRNLEELLNESEKRMMTTVTLVDENLAAGAKKRVKIY